MHARKIAFNKITTTTTNNPMSTSTTTTTTTTTGMADPNYIDLSAGCDPCGKFGCFLLTIMPIPFAPSIALSVTPYGCVGGKVSPLCVPPTKPNTLGHTRCVLGNTRSARWKHSCARTGDTFCSRPHHPFPHQAKIITYGTLISWVNTLSSYQKKKVRNDIIDCRRTTLVVAERSDRFRSRSRSLV